MTTLHAGGKFGNETYKVSGGLHGVGISVVNALSEWLELEITRDGQSFRQRYERGERVTDLELVGPAEGSGTSVHFMPDSSIFDSEARLDYGRFARRLRQLAYLVAGLEISVDDQREANSDRFHAEGGLSAFVRHVNKQRPPLHPDPIMLEGQAQGIGVEISLQWTSLYAEDLYSFVNTIRTSEGGTHEDGLHRGLMRAMMASGQALGREDELTRLRPVDSREGMSGVLAVWMHAPNFGGQTKACLTSQEVDGVVEELVARELSAWFEANPAVARAILDKALSAARVRLTARMARKKARHTSNAEEIDYDTYRTQFGIRSRNWHDSATWIAHDGLLAAHAEMCKVPPTAKLLDVCCGSGVVGHAFKGRVASLQGLDITPEMKALSETRLDAVALGTVFDIPFEDESFEIVVNREFMHLVPYPELMLEQVYRVLKPGGQFIFGQIVPYSPDDASWMYRIFKKKQPLLHHMFQADDLIGYLERAGLQGIETAEYLLWEDIDVWIDTVETTHLHRHEIRELYYNAPADVRRVHPFEVLPDGRIRDQWRWVIYSAFKPENGE
jgi:DNA gyrase subunit B